MGQLRTIPAAGTAYALRPRSWVYLCALGVMLYSMLLAHGATDGDRVRQGGKTSRTTHLRSHSASVGGEDFVRPQVTTRHPAAGGARASQSAETDVPMSESSAVEQPSWSEPHNRSKFRSAFRFLTSALNRLASPWRPAGVGENVGSSEAYPSSSDERQTRGEGRRRKLQRSLTLGRHSGRPLEESGRLDSEARKEKSQVRRWGSLSRGKVSLHRSASTTGRQATRPSLHDIQVTHTVSKGDVPHTSSSPNESRQKRPLRVPREAHDPGHSPTALVETAHVYVTPEDSSTPAVGWLTSQRHGLDESSEEGRSCRSSGSRSPLTGSSPHSFGEWVRIPFAGMDLEDEEEDAGAPRGQCGQHSSPHSKIDRRRAHREHQTGTGTVEKLAASSLSAAFDPTSDVSTSRSLASRPGYLRSSSTPPFGSQAGGSSPTGHPFTRERMPLPGSSSTSLRHGLPTNPRSGQKRQPLSAGGQGNVQQDTNNVRGLDSPSTPPVPWVSTSGSSFDKVS